jgi:hypothetical protein
MFILSFKNQILDTCSFKKCFFALQIFQVMGKKSDLSPRKVALIKVLLDQKQQSQREIAKRLQSVLQYFFMFSKIIIHTNFLQDVKHVNSHCFKLN